MLEADPEDVWVQRGGTDAHSGPGWYASLAEYPEEGSVFLGHAEHQFSDAVMAQAHLPSATEHFPGTLSGQLEESKMSNEHVEIESKEETVAKVGLEPTTPRL